MGHIVMTRNKFGGVSVRSSDWRPGDCSPAPLSGVQSAAVEVAALLHSSIPLTRENVARAYAVSGCEPHAALASSADEVMSLAMKIRATDPGGVGVSWAVV